MTTVNPVCFTSCWCLKALISVARRLRRAKRRAGGKEGERRRGELAVSIFAVQSTRFDFSSPSSIRRPRPGFDTGADCHPHFHDQARSSALLLLLSFLISSAHSLDLYIASPIATSRRCRVSVLDEIDFEAQAFLAEQMSPKSFITPFATVYLHPAFIK